jgi:hypothetical protein
MMPILLKLMVLAGGLTAFITGIAMLAFFDKFMEFNDMVNRNFLVGDRYRYNAFGVDRFLFGKSYVMAVLLLITGLFLLTVFSRYAPY